MEKTLKTLPIIEKTALPLGQREQKEDWDYYTTNGKKICIATDREIDFGRILGTIPLKGLCTAAMTVFFAQQAQEKGIATDLLETPHSHVLVVKNISKIPILFTVHAYITNGNETSLWVQYQKGLRHICGYTLPHGLKENQQLPEPLFIPVMNNHPTAKEAIAAEGLLDEDVLEEIEEIVKKVFAQGVAHAKKQGLIVATATYEFGLENNAPVLLHGFHTPKTAIYWNAHHYEKHFAAGTSQEVIAPYVVSDWLASVGFKGNGPAPPIPDEIRLKAAEEYMHITEKLTGKKIAVPKEDFVKEMEKSLLKK